ncbi:MAG: DUF2817 domain-containing protein [Bdellovibrionales bacterium]|nr:DUF2817 domain-containing protein [Bdellovibrionales bacterium]
MSHFPENEQLEALLRSADGHVRHRVVGSVKAKDREFPIHAIVVGSEDKTKPTLGLFGGVHGLERIGTHVLLAYLESLFQQLKWDKELARRFETCRIVSIPIVNPGGMYLGNRSNPNGVDLMRNAPIEAIVDPVPVLGGHRISPRLPYFRGAEGSSMEPEAQALVDFVRAEMFSADAAIAVDMHSGFGAIDRLWYPYAKTTDPFPRIQETQALGELLTKSYPNHIYRIEPQSVSYTTHGDLWDYLFDEHYAAHGPTGAPFIPWTLEMGSWIWIRKNPIQIFNPRGVFNPIKQHRLRRTLRRHLPLIDFFLRAVRHYEAWQR